VAAERFDFDLDDWGAWHPAEAARRLAGVDVPWAVIGGWSLDLFRGRQTREHEDLEIAIPEPGFRAVREAFADHEVYAIIDGQLSAIDEASLAESHQTWVRDPVSGSWRMDVVREQWDGDTWICRRDPRIRRPGSEVITHTADGIPYQRPEVALLFKAKHTREKDQLDFENVLPLLSPDARAWLTDALELVHPGHPWIEATRAG
jgi:hypothetical protein